MKNYFKLLAVLLCVGISTAARAATVKFAEPSEQKIADITLSSKAVIDFGKPEQLSRVAAGLRDKTFLKVKVYVLQIFSSNTAIQKNNGEAAMESLLQKNQPVALALTFVRNVDGKQIVEAYKESLAANGVKSDQEPFKQFLDEVQKRAESKKGVTLWFVLGSKEEITFYTEGKESITISGAPGSQFKKNFLSIWFGKPADSRLESLKEQLLK